MSKSFLINIPEAERVAGRTVDSIKHGKDCADFVCLEDGTIVKECRYCNLSLMCQQVDITEDGEYINMESHYLPIADPKTGEILEWQLYCTGMYENPDKPKTEAPEKVS
jgi:hypothetical protein